MWSKVQKSIQISTSSTELQITVIPEHPLPPEVSFEEEHRQINDFKGPYLKLENADKLRKNACEKWVNEKRLHHQKFKEVISHSCRAFIGLSNIKIPITMMRESL